jgi:hypothetical protein
MAIQIKAIKNLASFIFGAVLLLIGLACSLYDRGPGYYGGSYATYFYPFQTVGIVLILIGAAFAGLGLFYPSRTKTSSD